MKTFTLCSKIFLLTFVFCILAACHAGHGHCADKSAPLRVLATTFPVYQFTANICIDAPGVKVELLIPASAGCPHDFALKPADMKKLAEADILVMNGAGLEDFLNRMVNDLKNLAIIDASQGIALLEEGAAQHHHGHGKENGHGNPHTFAAPAQASLMVKNIARSLARLDAGNAAAYTANAEAYSKRLEALSGRFQNIGARAANKKIALEHDGLAYLAANANLLVVDIFQNSTSASQLAKLETKLKEEQPAMLAGDVQYPDRLLNTLSEATKIPFAKLDTCASGPAEANLDYYETIMLKNLLILEEHFD